MSERRKVRGGKPVSKMLEEFEQQEWGTNNWDVIQEKIREEDWQERQKSLTGMDEEQADWDEEE